MHAHKIMVTHPKSAQIDEKVGEVLMRMRSEHLRMLPVLSGAGRVEGVISTYSVMSHVVPEYIISGDLDAVPYAPDLGLLRKHFEELSERSVGEVMEKALTVHADESLLSVSAALCASGKHEYALVVDEDTVLLGVISAGDILDRLRQHIMGEIDA